MREKIIIWGGNKRSLELHNLDSHASISAFYLTKYLSKDYDIINCVDMDNPQEILKVNDAGLLLSTFQKGITNRMVQKGFDAIYRELRRRKVYLCSLMDCMDTNDYYEDMIFTAKQYCNKRRNRRMKNAEGEEIKIIYAGWCADRYMCKPEMRIMNNEFVIFIDHPPYSAHAPNQVERYYRALEKMFKKNKTLITNVTVYHQNNSGVVTWKFDGSDDKVGDIYQRAKKVPYVDMMEWYKKSDIFCVTHPESAGLAVIEAAMCGAKIYVPYYRWKRPFISNDLTDQLIAVRKFWAHSHRLSKMFEGDITLGIDKVRNHNALAGTNDWIKISDRIRESMRSIFDGQRKESI